MKIIERRRRRRLNVNENMLRSGEWMLIILNKGQTTIWEEIEIYSQEKVYTIERLLVDKNIGLVNTCNIK